uniref:Uncharacterized protein n=1 Tax=Anguilla anguilla TaxID=7936 RepID=A0A0E9WTG0_ANGAN
MDKLRGKSIRVHYEVLVYQVNARATWM